MSEPRHPALAVERSEHPAADAPLTSFNIEMARLGHVLRNARGNKYTIEALALRSGISAGLLSQIERGIGNPSFQTLVRVATALGVTVSDLLETDAYDDTSDLFVVRRLGRRMMTWPTEQVAFEVLTPRGQKALSVLRSVLPPQSIFHDFYQPGIYRGTVCLYVQSETISITLDVGERLLQAGDTLTCRSELIVSVGNPGAQPAELMTIITPGGL